MVNDRRTFLRDGPAPPASWDDAPVRPRPQRRWPGAPRPVGPRLDPRSSTTLARLGRFVTFLRWAGLSVAVALLPTAAAGMRALTVATALTAANTAVRTIRPLRLAPTWRCEAALLIDLGLAVTAIVVTGGFASPFLLTPLPAVLAAAYAWGYREGIAAAVLAVGTIGLATAVLGAEGETLRVGALVAVVVLAAAGLGGYTQQVWTAAERSHQATLDAATRLRLANELLHTLHDVVQTLPASLNLSEVLDSARRRLRDLLTPTVIVVLTPDDLVGGWKVELADGVALPTHLGDSALPAPVRAALVHGVSVREDDGAAPSTRFHPESRSLAAVALRTQRRVVGILVLEHSEPAHFGTADAELLDSLASTLALAIDNAGWFGKLYLLGAEGERARIARDLHDRFAQSLASVGFELERLSRRGGCGPEDLKALHDTIRSVVGELRDTLSELRVEVGEEPFSRVAERYVRRWSRRSGIAAAFTADTDGLRLPALVEQELCRILQEALANVERHAAAASTRVVWHLDDQRGVLEVADDGVGFDPARLAADRFGLRGMRERAEAIGASLRIDTTPGAGTRLRVEIEVAR